MKKSTAQMQKLVKVKPKLDENNLSKAAEQKIDKANKVWGHAKEAVLDAYNQLLEDGWGEREAGKICMKRCTIFSATTIRTMLPSEAKNPKMIRHKTKTPELERPQPEIATNSLQNTEDSSHQAGEKQETVHMHEGGQQEALEPEETDSQKIARKYQESQEEQKQEPKISKALKEQLESDDGEAQEIKPDDYRLEDLDKYPHELKNEIIKLQHERWMKLTERFKYWDGVVKQQDAEIKRLKSKNDGLKAKLEILEAIVNMGDAQQPTTQTKDQKYASYEEAKEYASSHGIKSKREWFEQSKSVDFPANLPKTRPDKAYKNEWLGWAAFLGKRKEKPSPHPDSIKKCAACDKKAVGEYENLGTWYCRKHLDDTISFNKEVEPVINKMYSTMAGGE